MRRFLLIPLVLLLLSCGAVAQQSRNSTLSSESKMVLTGAVYDLNGSVIVNEARVVVYDTAGRKYESATNDEGFYQIDLPLAVYRIEVNASGFCTERVERYKIVNATYGKMSLDFVLDVCPNIHKIQIPDKRKSRRSGKSKPIAE